MQLEKILQSQGFGSRKECRQLILQGSVSIADAVCLNPKQDVDVNELVFWVRGQCWQYRAQVYIAMYKPAGDECSHAPQHHRSVFTRLPREVVARGLQTVGRLDQDTTGLLLLTDDGRYLHALTHPRKHVPKRYRVTLQEPIKPQEIAMLCAGVMLQGEKTLLIADACIQHDSHVLSLTIHQGIYHQVKRMIAAVGNHVVALHREQVGALVLADLVGTDGLPLAEGQWCYLDAAQQAQALTSLL